MSAAELQLIESIRRRVARGAPHRTPLRLGIGDDCAVLRIPRAHEALVTTDFCIEGRHFRRDWHPAASVGHRMLARSLSDLAAMGARPAAVFLSLAIPAADAGTPWLDQLLESFIALAERHQAPLAGGDTSESPFPGAFADVCAVGSAPRGTALLRSGAKPGDLLYCTGTLGGAAHALELLARLPVAPSTGTAGGSIPTGAPGETGSPADLQPQLFPEPRLATGWELRKHRLATACMDLSDGISTDLTHLCQASGVAAELDLASLPAAPTLSALPAARAEPLMLHGGEDYELLFTAPPQTPIPPRVADVPVTRIGSIVPFTSSPSTGTNAGRITLLRPGGSRHPLAPGGWQHLRS